MENYTTINTKILATNHKTNKTSYLNIPIPLYLFSPFITPSEKFQRILTYVEKHYLFENFRNYTFHDYYIPETNWYN